LRLGQGVGAIAQLPGYERGWWSVQDTSAQLVGYLLDPHPGETIADACAAPGGKTTHIAELMQDRGTIWSCDRAASRLRKLQANVQRLGLHSIRIVREDSTSSRRWVNSCDRVLLDVPCSGLGTLHRHPDLRWRQSPEKIRELIQLQQKLMVNTADWVRPGGYLVYATCTLNSAENQDQISYFLDRHPQWKIFAPESGSWLSQRAAPEGWISILPTEWGGDGFFMAKLKKN
jgi:16S rRNA (cytosine967-C5)-methyltransferase